MTENEHGSHTKVPKSMKWLITFVLTLLLTFIGASFATDIIGNDNVAYASQNSDYQGEYIEEYAVLSSDEKAYIAELMNTHNNWYANVKNDADVKSTDYPLSDDQYEDLEKYASLQNANQTAGSRLGTYSIKLNENRNRNTTKGTSVGFPTLYAQLIMGPGSGADGENGNEIPEDHDVAQSVNDGKNSATMSYSYIANKGDALSQKLNEGGDSNAGTQLATYLSSISTYGYVSTMSGWSIGIKATNAFTGIFKVFGALIVTIALGMTALMEIILEYVVDFFIYLNPYRLISTRSGQGIEEGNPFYGAIQQFLNGIGLNETFFNVLVLFMLTIFTGIFAFQLMKTLTNGVAKAKVSKPIAKWATRVATIFLAISLPMFLVGEFANSLDEIAEESSGTSFIVPQYIVNTKSWAVGNNLMPSPNMSLNGVDSDNYVADSFAPSGMRSDIAQINKDAYTALSSGSQEAKNSVAQSLSLLFDWSSNKTFGVNEYGHSIMTYANSGYLAARQYDGSNIAPSNGLTNKEGVPIDQTQISGYIWSANQELEDDNGPNSKTQAIKRGTDEAVNYSYNAASQAGVKSANGRSSLSTQSVALLLQSDLNEEGITLYLENIPPKGLYEKATNLSPQRTVWHSASLVGAGPMGTFGSFLEMLSHAIVQMALYIMTVWVLLTGPLLNGYVKAITRTFEAIIIGEPMSMVGGMALSLGAGVTSVFALAMPPIVINLIQNLSNASVSLLTSDFLNRTGVKEIVSAILLFAITWWLIAPKDTQNSGIKKFADGSTTTSPYYMLICIPLNLAQYLDRKAMIHAGGMRGMRERAKMFGDNAGKGKRTPNRNGVGFGGNAQGDAYGSGQHGQGANELDDGTNARMATDGMGRDGANVGFVNPFNQAEQNGALRDGDGNPIDGEEAKEALNTTAADKEILDNEANADVESDVRNDLEDGGLRDAEGNLLTPNEDGTYTDDDGNLYNSEGHLIDDEGNLVDEEGNIIANKRDDDSELYEDQNGNLMLADGTSLTQAENGLYQDANGNYYNENGELVDENGNVIDDKRADDNQAITENEDGTYALADGTALTKAENGLYQDKDGNYYNENGELVDESGNVIDDKRNLDNAAVAATAGAAMATHQLADGTDVTQNTDGTFSDKEGNLYNADGHAIDDNGNLIDDDGNIVAEKRDDSSSIYENENGDLMLADGTGVTDNGDGTFTDEDGNLYNDSGHAINDQGDLIDDDGDVIASQMTDSNIYETENGDMVLADGTEITDNGDGTYSDALGNTYDETGQVITDDNADITYDDDGNIETIDGDTVTLDGEEYVGESGAHYDSEGNMLTDADGNVVDTTQNDEPIGAVQENADGNVVDTTQNDEPIGAVQENADGNVVDTTQNDEPIGAVQENADGTFTTENGDTVTANNDDTFTTENGDIIDKAGTILTAASATAAGAATLGAVTRTDSGAYVTANGTKVTSNADGTYTTESGQVVDSDGKVIDSGQSDVTAQSADTTAQSTDTARSSDTVEVDGGIATNVDAKSSGDTQTVVSGDGQTARELVGKVQETDNGFVTENGSRVTANGDGTFTTEKGQTINKTGEVLAAGVTGAALGGAVARKGETSDDVTNVENTTQGTAQAQSDTQGTTQTQSTAQAQGTAQAKDNTAQAQGTAQAKDNTAQAQGETITVGNNSRKAENNNNSDNDNDDKDKQGPIIVGSNSRGVGKAGQNAESVQNDGRTQSNARDRVEQNAQSNNAQSNNAQSNNAQAKSNDTNEQSENNGSLAKQRQKVRQVKGNAKAGADKVVGGVKQAENARRKFEQRALPESMHLSRAGAEKRTNATNKVAEFINRNSAKGSLLGLGSSLPTSLTAADRQYLAHILKREQKRKEDDEKRKNGEKVPMRKGVRNGRRVRKMKARIDNFAERNDSVEVTSGNSIDNSNVESDVKGGGMQNRDTVNKTHTEQVRESEAKADMQNNADTKPTSNQENNDE